MQVTDSLINQAQLNRQSLHVLSLSPIRATQIIKFDSFFSELKLNGVELTCVSTK